MLSLLTLQPVADPAGLGTLGSVDPSPPITCHVWHVNPCACLVYRQCLSCGLSSLQDGQEKGRHRPPIPSLYAALGVQEGRGRAQPSLTLSPTGWLEPLFLPGLAGGFSLSGLPPAEVPSARLSDIHWAARALGMWTRRPHVLLCLSPD